MATIKSFTDIPQSKKLVKILPIESADMHWSKDFDSSWFVDLAEYTSVKIPKYVGKVEEHLLPCWSLAALFGILQYPTLFQRADRKWGCTVWIDATMPYSVEDKDDPIDACVAMIEKLHELNLL